jgi:hypothetical protein
LSLEFGLLLFCQVFLLFFVAFQSRFVVFAKPQDRRQLVSHRVKVIGDLQKLPFDFVFVVLLELFNGRVVEGFD